MSGADGETRLRSALADLPRSTRVRHALLQAHHECGYANHLPLVLGQADIAHTSESAMRFIIVFEI